MPRIYARVRREYGPEAVIVRTRSLFREGAEPLIEVIAAPSDANVGLPLQLQTSLISGALEQAVRPSRGLTVGDLEELASREEEQEQRHAATLERFQTEESPAPEWLEGFVGSAPTLANGAPLPMPDAAAGTPPSPEWAARPRPSIVTRPRREDRATGNAPIQPPPPLRGELNTGELIEQLVDAGFTVAAAEAVAGHARPGDSPAHVLAAYLESREVAYPEEHHTALITIQGPVGAGRTTALMRMALDCGDSGRPVLLVAADGMHVAAREQVRAYAEATGLDSVSTFEPHDVIRAATRAAVGTCLFVDTAAGSWRSPAIAGIPHFAYLALPAHWSREALDAAIQDIPLNGFAGAILTFTDLCTDLTPVVSLLVESGLGIAFLSSSRDVSTGIAIADPFTIASGIFTTPTRESTNGRLFATA